MVKVVKMLKTLKMLKLWKYQQAVAELGQAQYKLGLDFTLISCGFGLSRLSFV